MALDPEHADTLQLMRLLSLQAQQYDAAIEWIDRANQADPKTDYLASLGTALEQQGRHAEAPKAFEKVVQIRPDDAELRNRLCDVLVRCNARLKPVIHLLPSPAIAIHCHRAFWFRRCVALIARI